MTGRVLASDAAEQPARLQAYVRASDLPALVDAYGLHAAPSRPSRTILLRPVTDPWPFADSAAAAPRLVHALDLLELAADGGTLDMPLVYAAWELIEQHAAQDVRSWYRATRPPRAGSTSKVAVIAPKRALRPVAATATDADLLAAMLFAIGQPVRRHDLLAASGWTQARLQAAVNSLLAEPPRGQQVMVDDDRLQLVAACSASSLVQRLFRHLERGTKVLESLDLPETVWLVLAIIILDQPITRAEITARRMADSDRQVQILLRHRLIREEPRAAMPGRGIPLITTDLVLRRLGVSWIGDLQHQLLTAAAEREPGSNSQTAPALRASFGRLRSLHPRKKSKHCVVPWICACQHQRHGSLDEHRPHSRFDVGCAGTLTCRCENAGAVTMADLGPCSACGAPGSGIRLNNRPYCDRCADERLAAVTGWPTLPTPPPAEVIIGPDKKRHFVRYRLLRMPGGVVGLAEELGGPVYAGYRLELLARADRG